MSLRRAALVQQQPRSTLVWSCLKAPACIQPGPTTTQLRHHTDAQTVREPHVFEQMMTVDNLEYMEGLTRQLKKTGAVEGTWHPVVRPLMTTQHPPEDVPLVHRFTRPNSRPAHSVSDADVRRIAHLNTSWMVRMFEAKGHLIADLDPLGMFDADLSPDIPLELQPSYFGYNEADMETHKFAVKSDPTVIGGWADVPDTPLEKAKTMTLREILDIQRARYCGKIGYEYMHVRSVDEQVFFRTNVLEPKQFSREEKLQLFEDVIKGDRFESVFDFYEKRSKRFGVDGGEALIPLLTRVLERSSESGVAKCIIGMPHRGRLNVLHNICKKPMDKIMREFFGTIESESEQTNAGDVKYHMGWRSDYECRSGKKVDVELLPNPSHLETVGPVTAGYTRSLQRRAEGGNSEVLPIVMHGDASYAGQGVCYEMQTFVDLPNYGSGGVIHIVVNNQIGYTTPPNQSRSTSYCTDLAKVINAPVLHVNGDCVESVARVAEIAANFRSQYHRDIVIDFVCYRRNGHNEGDVPEFTQPLMYKQVKAQLPVMRKYAQQLIEAGVVTEAQAEEMIDGPLQTLKKQFKAIKDDKTLLPRVFNPNPPGLSKPTDRRTTLTGLAIDKIKEMGDHLTRLPEGFKPHDNVWKRTIEPRRQSFLTGKDIGWASAEQLAFAAINHDGHCVRLSGQDVQRGTWAQRHFVLHDKETSEQFASLKVMPTKPEKVNCTLSNSPLSEYAVGGFEVGYSMANDGCLVMWEAQFGDFSNGAQIIWDQYLSSMEAKWGRTCGLVVSLPHGYDGQGPEHSSGRIERWLQLADARRDAPPEEADLPEDDMELYQRCEKEARECNWQVCYTTTPANYFHMLRRQMARDFRKPVISFFSKSRLKTEVSQIEEFKEGTRFRAVLDDTMTIEAPKRIVVCSGQAYHVLRDARNKEEFGKDVVLLRLEQIAPFPFNSLRRYLKQYNVQSGSVEIVFAQEEPKNMGAWSFVRPRLGSLLRSMGVNTPVRFVGRAAAASPATGFGVFHDKENKELIEAALK